jgi:hypothetical protein
MWERARGRLRSVPENYRSYVIRVRRRVEPTAQIRLDVEDLLDGRHAAVKGEAARDLADVLETLVGHAGEPEAGGAARLDPLPPEGASA